MREPLGHHPKTFVIVDDASLSEALRHAGEHDRFVVAEGAFPTRGNGRPWWNGVKWLVRWEPARQGAPVAVVARTDSSQ